MSVKKYINTNVLMMEIGIATPITIVTEIAQNNNRCPSPANRLLAFRTTSWLMNSPGY